MKVRAIDLITGDIVDDTQVERVAYKSISEVKVYYMDGSYQYYDPDDKIEVTPDVDE